MPRHRRVVSRSYSHSPRVIETRLLQPRKRNALPQRDIREEGEVIGGSWEWRANPVKHLARRARRAEWEMDHRWG